MITDEDTTKIVNRVIEANKQLFYSKPEMNNKFEELRDDFSKLQTSVASFASGTKNNSDEIKVVNQRANEHQDWIQKAASKIGLEYKV